VAREQGRRERDKHPGSAEDLRALRLPDHVGHRRAPVFSNGAAGPLTDWRNPDMPRPPHNATWTGDWYMHDPCTNYNDDPLWYAPDLIEQILLSRVPHEIGTHSF